MHFAYGQIGKNGLLVRNFELDLGLIELYPLSRTP